MCTLGVVHHGRVHTLEAANLPSVEELLTEHCGVELGEHDSYEWTSERVGIFRVRLRYDVTVTRLDGAVERHVFDVPVR